MRICISYIVNTFPTTGDALEFIYPFINLEMIGILSSKSFHGGYSDFEFHDAVDKLRENGDRMFSVTSEFNSFHDEKNKITFRKDATSSTEMFWVDLETEDHIKLEELLIASGIRQFTFAYKFDFHKALWQSEEIIANYEYHKRPHGHLKKITNPNLPPIIGHKVDIFQNPGHQKLTYTMNLMAAPEMWFGPGCWKYFDKELVRSFPSAQEIRPLTEDILYVRLFNWETPDYETAGILDLQRRFRDWTGMDAVEMRLVNQLANTFREQ